MEVYWYVCVDFLFCLVATASQGELVDLLQCMIDNGTCMDFLIRYKKPGYILRKWPRALHFADVTIDGYMYTPIMYAVAERIPTLLANLLDNVNRTGGTGDTQVSNGFSALLLASMMENEEAVTLLCQSSCVNVNVRDNEGNTALMYAIKYRRYSAVNMLIESGADLNVENHMGKTPLLRALESNEHSIVADVLNGGAEINKISLATEQTVLDSCVIKGKVFHVFYLLQQGADPAIHDPSCNAITSAAYYHRRNCFR